MCGPRPRFLQKGTVGHRLAVQVLPAARQEHPKPRKIAGTQAPASGKGRVAIFAHADVQRPLIASRIGDRYSDLAALGRDVENPADV